MKKSLFSLLLLPAALAAEGPAWLARLSEAAQGAQARFATVLDAASVHPDPAGILGVVALLALLPMSGVVPMSLLCLLAGTAFRPAIAAPVIMSGLLLNTAMAWGLARTVFGARLEAWLERREGALGAIRRGARQNGLKWAILCRFIPAPFITQPMVLASTGVGLGTTLLGTFIGMTPWVGAYVWLGKAGRQGSLKSLGLAATALVGAYVLAALIRRRFVGSGEALEPLRPRHSDRPCLQLYTVPSHELSDEARAELAGLRDRLGFEVDETVLDAAADPALKARYEDHAPVALLDGEKLFSFKMDENVLRVRLGALRGQGAA